MTFGRQVARPYVTESALLLRKAKSSFCDEMLA